MPAIFATLARGLPSPRVCLNAATAFLAVVLLLHLGLLTRGSWGGDEYRTIGLYRLHGAEFLWFRFWSWSPRPVSEALIWLYAWSVTALGRPLIVPALALCWCWFLATAWPALAGCRRDTRAWRILGTLAILGTILLGRQVAPVFYWPFGAVAYVPVVAAALLLLFVHANEHIRRKTDNAAVAIVLIATAWSSEAGTLLVLVHAGLTTAQLLWSGPPRQAARTVLLYWLPPIAAALLVLWLLQHGHRFGDTMRPNGNPALYHHSLASLGEALLRFLPELLTSGGTTVDAGHLAIGAMSRLLFFLGVQACWHGIDPADRRTRSHLPLLALSLAVTSIGMLASGFREFGDLCCGQHVFVRQSLDVVVLAALAIWIPPVFGSLHRRRACWAPAALSLAVALLLAPRARDIWHDYWYYGEPARARTATWHSGFSPGPAMTVYDPTPDHLFPIVIPTGYHAGPDTWWVDGILTFFGKRSVNVVIGTGPPTH